MFGVCKYPFLTWLFSSMNGVIGNVLGMGENFKVCRHAFFHYLKVTNKLGVSKVYIIHFLLVQGPRQYHYRFQGYANFPF